jgi:hypothetical protein
MRGRFILFRITRSFSDHPLPQAATVVAYSCASMLRSSSAVAQPASKRWSAGWDVTLQAPAISIRWVLQGSHRFL